MYNVLNIYAQTLCLSRTPRRLKTSCESTSEEAGLARRKTKFKIPFQFPDLSKTAYFKIPMQRYELITQPMFVLLLSFSNEANWEAISTESRITFYV